MTQAYWQGPNPSSEYTLCSFPASSWTYIVERAAQGVGPLHPASALRSRQPILFQDGGDFSEPGVRLVTTLAGYRRKSLLTGAWIDSLPLTRYNEEGILAC